MLNVSDDVFAALGDSEVVTETRATATYQNLSAELNILADGETAWDASGEIQATSSVHVFGVGDSLVPRSRDALLAPYGQEVQLVRRVFVAGEQLTDIPLGVYRIIGNDGGRQSPRGDWEVRVKLADRFRGIQKAKLVPDPAVPSGATVYGELSRLVDAPLLIDPDIPDASVPRSVVYDDRMDAVHKLAEIAGAKPRFTRQGALTLRRTDRWATATVPDFEFEGELGDSSGQSDDWYNWVWTHNEQGEFSQFAAVTDDANPLSINRAGIATYEHSSPVYTTNAASRSGAETILARLTGRRSSTVTAYLDARGLLLELSDFGWVHDPYQGRSVLGEVSKIAIPHDPTERVRVELIVAEEV